MIPRRALCLLAAVALASCASASQPTAAPSAAAPTQAATAAASPSTTQVAYADTLRIGMGIGLTGSALFLQRGETPYNTGVSNLAFGRLVYSGLYRYDATDQAVPDLADRECFVPGSDGRVLRCHLVATTFQDGTPLTADDVVLTYQMFMRAVMWPAGGWDILDNLRQVRAVDPRTVEFVLAKVDPIFMTSVLPIVPIFSRHDIEAAVADYDARTAGLNPKDLAKLATTINDEISRSTPVCTDARVAEANALMTRIGWVLYREDFQLDNGTFDACGWLGFAAFNLGETTTDGGGAAWTLAQTGIDHTAGAVGVEDFTRPQALSGTGPYRYVSQDANTVRLEAWPGYHGGTAATKYVEFVRAAADGSDITAGRVDILPDSGLGAAFRATAAAHGVTAATPPSAGYYALTFNVRPGRLFADVTLRRALQRCIDLPADVDAATGGAGTPIYGPVIPGSWADDPTLPKPARDVAAARQLIEASGWRPEPDGVYAKNGVQLATDLLVRSEDASRDAMANLIAAQARDCGMALAVKAVAWGDISSTFFTYPHNIPGTKTPFDLYLAKWSMDVDPNAVVVYATDLITTAKDSSGGNFGGFSDPAFDRLAAAGTATYDQAERTRIYRQAQQELAAQLPAIFLWASNRYDAVRTAVATEDGPLDLKALNWAWAPEKLVVVKAGTP